mgnify:CR=1 FL=1
MRPGVPGVPCVPGVSGVPGLRGVPAVSAVPSVHGLAAVHVLWLKQATRQTMPSGSIPLKPIGKPPPYTPPKLTRLWCISPKAARKACNASYPSDLCAAVVRARDASSKEKEKEMKEKYEKEKKNAWRTAWRQTRRWKRNKRWCQARLRAQETFVVPSPAEGPSPASTAASLPPRFYHSLLFDEKQKICRDLTSINDPESLLAVLSQAMNAPRRFKADVKHLSACHAES